MRSWVISDTLILAAMILWAILLIFGLVVYQ